jgi:hypothetical protein
MVQFIILVGPLPTRSSLLPTTGTFNSALSMLKIWFFGESRMILVYTSLTHDGKDLSLCTRLQALDFIDYSTRMSRRY